MRSFTWLALMVLLACSPKVDQQAVIAAEVTGYALELKQCADAAKAADGGMAMYESCAVKVDAKHGLDGGK